MKLLGRNNCFGKSAWLTNTLVFCWDAIPQPDATKQETAGPGAWPRQCQCQCQCLPRLRMLWQGHSTSKMLPACPSNWPVPLFSHGAVARSLAWLGKNSKVVGELPSAAQYQRAICGSGLSGPVTQEGLDMFRVFATHLAAVSLICPKTAAPAVGASSLVQASGVCNLCVRPWPCLAGRCFRFPCFSICVLRMRVHACMHE